MRHDRAYQSQRQLPIPSQHQLVSYVTGQTQVLVPPVRGRGKPATLTALHLCLGIVLCGLQGFGSQLKLWRQFCLEPMGPFAPVCVVDQAVYNRLARAAGAMRAFFEQVSGWMGEQLVGLEERSLAAWASQVLALDESTLDAVGRWLPELRQVLPGDPRRLSGRISALFDVRRQQWVRVELWQEAVANCQQQARLLLEGLLEGTLLLFDRGYLSFPWFDTLTQRKLWWISRYANHASMQIRHLLYQGDGVLDAIVWLGKYRADRAKYAVRLVQFYHRGRLHQYLTNVLDPQQLSLAAIARLYARRWDIELAFGVLKEHLHLSQLWSAKWEGVEPFGVSIDLLVEVVPRLLERGIAPLPYLGQRGRALGHIRPSSRLQMQVPFVDPSWIMPAPPEAVRPRETVRYAQRKCIRGPRPSRRKAG
jgi:hypothetical protein